MDIKYIEAAMSIADHGSDCWYTQCQIDLEILSQQSVSIQMRTIANLASSPIRAERERIAEAEIARQEEYARTMMMTYQEYTTYSQSRARAKD